MRAHRWFSLILLCFAWSHPAWALSDAPNPDPERAPWSKWQGRLTLGKTGSGLRTEPANAADSTTARWSGLSAMGDYYFTRAIGGASNSGGFRATSGLVVGARNQLFSGLVPSTSGGVFNVDRRVFGPSAASGSALDPSNDLAALSYLGVGYTGLSSRRGWAFSADLGLVSLNPGNAIKLGRMVGGTQNIDELTHDLRLSPVVQLGVSYSF